MKKLNVKNNFTKSNQNGITLIALIVTIVVLIIIAGISIATLTADNGVLRQTNLAKITQIEATAREQVKLACSAMRLAIAEARADDNSYSAIANSKSIQAKLLKMIEDDNTGLNKEGWGTEAEVNDNVETFTITYAGDDYKQACNNDDATITYTIKLGQSAIEITNEVNATLQDQNGNDVEIDIGAGSTEEGGSGGGSGSGSGSGAGSSDGTGSVKEVAGLYETGSNYAADKQKKTWSELLADGTVHVENGVVYTNVDIETGIDNSAAALDGDLVFPDTITVIGDFNLNTYTGNNAFVGCTNLTGIVIPASLTKIATTTFRNCTNLKTVYYEGTLEQWCNIDFGTGNFINNPCVNGAGLYIGGNLVTDITIPEGLTTISDGAFLGCTSLESVNFGENSQLTSIGIGSFYGCTNLANVKIPDSVTYIGPSAFNGCTSIESITLPDSVTDIYDMTFLGCTSLTSITIPNSVTFFESDVFEGCTSLTTIQYLGTTSEWNSIDFRDDTWHENVPATTVTCSDGIVTL